MPAQNPHFGHGVDLSTPEPQPLSEAERAALKLGATAYARLARGAHREDWRRIGDSLNALQHAAMVAAGANQPVGARYNACHAHYARKHRLTNMLDGLDKPTKSHAMWMARTWPTIEAWLAKMPERDANRITHPTALKRRFERETAPPSDPTEPSNTVHAKLVRALDELDYVKVDRDELQKVALYPGMPSADVAARVAGSDTDEIAALIADLQAVLTERRQAETAAVPI